MQKLKDLAALLGALTNGNPFLIVLFSFLIIGVFFCITLGLMFIPDAFGANLGWEAKLIPSVAVGVAGYILFATQVSW